MRSLCSALSLLLLSDQPLRRCMFSQSTCRKSASGCLVIFLFPRGGGPRLLSPGRTLTFAPSSQHPCFMVVMSRIMSQQEARLYCESAVLPETWRGSGTSRIKDTTKRHKRPPQRHAERPQRPGTITKVQTNQKWGLKPPQRQNIPP